MLTLILNLSDNYSIAEIANWIIKNNIQRLNIAGPRASQTSDIYDAAYSILHQILDHRLLKKDQQSLIEERSLREKL